MNKSQLVDALAERLGDRRTAANAVEGLLDTIVDTVRAGDSVTIPGFGVFESRARAARTARNPRTGEVIDVPATTVPAFRAGAGFRAAVGGGRAPAPRPVAARTTAPAPAEEAVAAEPAKRGKPEKAAAKAEKSPKPTKSAAKAVAKPVAKADTKPDAKSDAKSNKATKTDDKGKKPKAAKAKK